MGNHFVKFKLLLKQTLFFEMELKIVKDRLFGF